MRTVSIFLALINSLLAGVLITFLLTSLDFQISMAWWSIARIALALTVILIGVLTWIGEIMPMRSSLLVMGSLFLVAAGPASIVWAFHRASLTGHLEYYRLIYGASLFVQGLTLLFGITQENGAISTAKSNR